jgi:hypothetical protein
MSFALKKKTTCTQLRTRLRKPPTAAPLGGAVAAGTGGGEGLGPLARLVELEALVERLLFVVRERSVDAKRIYVVLLALSSVIFYEPDHAAQSLFGGRLVRLELHRRSPRRRIMRSCISLRLLRLWTHASKLRLESLLAGW